jgi:flavodoxin
MARLAMQAFLRVRAKIAPTTSDAASYDMVVIGSPVWAGKMSSPIRTYLAQNKDKFTSVAFFCTHGQPGSEGSTKMLESMETLSGKKAAAVLDVAANDVESGEYVEKAKRFATALLELPASP